MKLILLIPTALLLVSCTTSTSQSVTHHPDGSVTTVPVLSPKDQAFHDQCKQTLDSKF